MPISSYIIRSRPEDQNRILSRLSEQQGATPGPCTPNGIPLVLESHSTEESIHIIEKLEKTEGVLQIQLVFHSTEDSIQHAQ